jgi:hypothetical protein
MLSPTCKISMINIIFLKHTKGKDTRGSTQSKDTLMRVLQILEEEQPIEVLLYD